MVLSKRGQAGIFFLVMIGIVVFILGLALAKPIIQNSTQVMTNMGCSNTSINTYTKVTCGVIDVSSPFIISVILGLGGMFLTAKLMGR